MTSYTCVRQRECARLLVDWPSICVQHQESHQWLLRSLTCLFGTRFQLSNVLLITFPKILIWSVLHQTPEHPSSIMLMKACLISATFEVLLPFHLFLLSCLLTIAARLDAAALRFAYFCGFSRRDRFCYWAMQSAYWRSRRVHATPFHPPFILLSYSLYY